jgi:hypothetical protein
MENKQITKEVIDAFFAGHDPMERIIKFECGYDEDKVSIIYRNEKGEKITPEEITENTRLEYYKGDIFSDFNSLTKNDNTNDSWLFLLNASIDIKKQFI